MLLLLGASPALGAIDTFSSRYLDQAVLVFRADDVKNHRVPARIHLHNLPVVFGSQVALACLGVSVSRDELIAFLPESQSCVPLTGLPVAAGQPQLTGHSFRGLQRDRSKLQQRLEKNLVVVLQPQVSAEPTPGLCSCPGNQAPEVTVRSGSPQSVLAGTAIEPIDFVATDVDSEVLSEYFSYTLNGGGKQLGLPGGLFDDCVPGIGTITCSVVGTAPVGTGDYLITMDVIDGFNLGTATATLTVLSETIFADGFEDGS